MQVKSQRSSKKARIEIIPLIDVIMFLLATFVLFTLSMNKTKNIEMQMPGPPGPQTTEASPPTSVSVDSNGDYFWNKERITYDELLVRLNGLKQQEADPKVVVIGEEGAQFGAGMRVVDEARNAKIFKVSFNTTAVKSVR